MPAASPTSIARRIATGWTTPPHGIMPARIETGFARLKSAMREILSRKGPIASVAVSRPDCTRPARPTCTDADAGDNPADVAGSETTIDEAVKPVRFGQLDAGILVLDTKQKLAVAAEAEGLRDSRVGTIGPDDESRGARVAEIEAALRALRRHERRLVRDDGAGLDGSLRPASASTPAYPWPGSSSRARTGRRAGDSGA